MNNMINFREAMQETRLLERYGILPSRIK